MILSIVKSELGKKALKYTEDTISFDNQACKYSYELRNKIVKAISSSLNGGKTYEYFSHELYICRRIFYEYKKKFINEFYKNLKLFE